MTALKSIVVLGMHRSATSMVARSLHLAGEVWMGHDLLLDAPGNPAGHFEHIPTANLSNEILGAAGGNWYDPPSRDAILEVGPRFTDAIAREIRALEGGRPAGVNSVGFKDPRLCLTIELFHPHLRNPQYVVTYRNPDDIATSLSGLHRIAVNDGARLAREYYRRANEFVAGIYT